MAKQRIRLSMLASVLIVGFLVTAVPGCAPSKPEKGQITAYTAATGTGIYVLTFALAEIVNKNSTKLGLTVVETPSSGTAMLRLAQDPQARKNAIAAYSSAPDVDAIKGIGGFKDYRYNIALIAKAFHGPMVFVTKNPNIKTPKNLIGKRICVGASETAAATVVSEHLLNLWGIRDQITPVYLSRKEGASALISGEIDALNVGIIAIDLGKKHSPSPALKELAAQTKLYYINFDIDQV